MRRTQARPPPSGREAQTHPYPDPEDERVTDRFRTHTDAVEDLRRIKQQPSAILLINGHRYNGKSNRSAAHLPYLRHLEKHAKKHSVLVEYLLALDGAHTRIDRL